MPTYEYACQECGEHLEVVQSFKDEALTTCNSCGGPLRKVFSAAGIIFKGSGYYVTDSRNKKSAAPASSSGSSNGAADAAASTSESKSDAAPAKTESKPSTPKAESA